MKVAHLTANTSGGAGGEAVRLHRALIDLGVDSTMVVGTTTTDDPSVVVAGPSSIGRARMVATQRLDSLPLRIHRARPTTYFSPGVVGWFDARSHPAIEHADVVGLNWVANAFLSPAAIARLRAPVVWRLSDMWPFTGGCHYSGDCDRFEDRCGRCPQLASERTRDVSRLGWRRKEQAWREQRFTIVAPTRWMADAAGRSSLFGAQRIEVIATGVDLDIFRPVDRFTARDLLGLPQDVELIVFGAVGATSDPRKGFAELDGALRLLAADAVGATGIRLVVFGSDAPVTAPLPVINVGRISDEVTLALVYAAADVVVVPSREDNLPNVALEALACGAPVAAFRTGGLPEAIIHERTGWLADRGDTAGLAAGLRWLLEDPARREAIGRAARADAVERFSLREQARHYLRLYEELLADDERRHS